MANIENKDPKKDFKKRMVKALFSYTPVNSDELTLKINDVLEVIEETEEGWWKGILDGNIGMFPSNFVIELDSYPEEFNNKLMNELSPSKNISKAKNVSQQQETLNKHEPERPILPCPSKKPQPMQPVKKPTRSSLGPKLPPSPVVSTAKSSESSPPIPTSFPSSSEKSEESSKIESTVDKDSKHKKEMEFDLIEPTSKKLIHLTANRAKAPNRRPPSFIFLKENERDHGSVTTDSRRLSEPLLAEFNAILPLNESQKKSAISASNVEIKPKVPPSRPSPPITKSNSLTKQDTALISKKEIKKEDSIIKPQDSAKKDAFPDKVPVLTKEILQPNKGPELPSQVDSKSSFFKVPSSVATINPELPSQLAPKVSSIKIPPSIAAKTSTIATPAILPNAPSEGISATPLKTAHHIVTKPPATLPTEISSNGATSLETQVLDIKEDLKVVRNNMVSKNDYNALLKQVNELKVLLETYNKNCTKAISDLKEELNEERRLRSSVELELQRLKECQTT
ncbi:SH3 domain-containing kinase-binding protein 1 [Nephila pilipes]|uniref:SH3 domain-containing kinase-binding protein 1 n=1 Tax=Nephila pilipes TaxID=299642 RepID=A0A8X6TGW3_NEPPI|nr:SH3 domain-containing kinase-binding protein 1 [Nephila pilipes]